jgi:glyoxylase-like metal-dependent hydrolase (beta-lactamase superfamily II)
MYVISGDKSAIIIDPHEAAEAFKFLKENGIQDVLILLTHEHPDHTSGVNKFKENFNTVLICQKNCADFIADEKNNRPILVSFILAEQDRLNGTNTAEMFNKDFNSYKCSADIIFEKDYVYKWHGHEITFTAIPGHSEGSVAIIIDGKILFSGDSLLKDIAVITRFPGGNTKVYNQTALPFFKSLNKDIVCFPGHGESFVLKEVISNV